MANDNLIQKLKAAGVVLHDHHRVVYKYMDVTTAMHILTGRSLMFTKPDNFNDPFEVHMGLLDFDFLEDQAVEIYQKHLNDGKEVTDEMRRVLETQGKKLISESVQKVFRKFRENVGITCFAMNPGNALMWAHYANKHKGVCLGFTIPGHNRTRDAFNVNYVDAIKPIKFFADEERDLSFWYWVFTKSYVWAYEQEVRLASFFSNGIQPFDGIDIVEVYYGVGTAQEDIDAIEIMLPYFPGVQKRVKMEISSKTFDLIETTYDKRR